MPETKAQLLARMTLARARVWRGLANLPAGVLAGQRVAGDWTPRDTLAHLAFWDDTRAEQLDLMLRSRLYEIEWITDSINTAVYEERREWPIDRVVAAAVAARARFLALVEPMSDADLERTMVAGDGSTVTIRQWIERRPRHDESHLLPIRTWRETTRPRFRPGPKCVLAAALDGGRDALLAYGAIVPPEQASTLPVCGEWTWQDVVGHVADWEIYGVDGLRAMAEGGRVDTNPDIQEWNVAHAAARRGEPFETTWADFEKAREDLLALLAGFDDDRLAAPANSMVPFLDHNYFWFGLCALHDVEHAEMMEAALGAT